MDILTPELLDLARERGSAFVAAAIHEALIEWTWDSTDRSWEAILRHIEDIVQGQRGAPQDLIYVGVVTEGVTVDNETYEMKEHLTMTVVHPAGYESWKIPIGTWVPPTTDAADELPPVVSLGELPPEELEFDLAALQAVLPW